MKIIIVFISTFILTSHAFSQTTSLVMSSEQGDYIGQGQNYDLNESNGTFTPYVNSDGSVRILYSGDEGSFSVTLGPKDLQSLIIGPYPFATRYPFNSPTAPGFNASGFGRGCNTSESSFDVLDVEFDLNNELVSLVADFEQHCGDLDDPALTGTLMYNSFGAPYPPIPDDDSDSVANTIDNCINSPNLDQLDSDLDGIGNVCDIFYTNTNFIFDSEEGDYIGQGLYQEFYLADGNITASRNYDNGVTIRFKGRDSWTLNFAAPGDVDLTTGLYSNATRFPFQDVTEPGLDISGAGRGCNTLEGNFEVTNLVYDSEGEVEKFEATFEQHCSGMTPALFGLVNYNKDPEDLIFIDSFE